MFASLPAQSFTRTQYLLRIGLLTVVSFGASMSAQAGIINANTGFELTYKDSLRLGHCDGHIGPRFDYVCHKNSWVKNSIPETSATGSVAAELPSGTQLTGARFLLSSRLKRSVAVDALDIDWVWGKKYFWSDDAWHCTLSAFTCNVEALLIADWFHSNIVFSVAGRVLDSADLTFAPSFSSLVCDDDINGPSEAQRKDPSNVWNCSDSAEFVVDYRNALTIDDPEILDLLSFNALEVMYTNFGARLGLQNNDCPASGCHSTQIFTDSINGWFAIKDSFSLRGEYRYESIPVLPVSPPGEPPASVPEPGTTGLVGLAALGLVWSQRRRRQRARPGIQ